MPDELAIDVSGLGKSFGAIHAVQGVDLQVPDGKIFGLIGPDGAGKTTTIRMLVGIMTPTSGGGKVLGHDLLKQAEQIKQDIGYMSQRFSLYADLTVAENIDYFSEIYSVPHSERKSREEQMMEFSRLGPFKDRLAGNLSGGMKQKLALACTLMHQPRLLFLDEPTTGVDPVSRRDFWKILYQLVAEGMTIFVSTPYMDEAERCSSIALMDRGRILEVDSPENLRKSLKTNILEVQAEPQREAWTALEKVPELQGVQVFGDRLHARAADARTGIEAIRKACSDAGINLEDVKQIEPGLEDVFVSIIESERGDKNDDACSKPSP